MKKGSIIASIICIILGIMVFKIASTFPQSTEGVPGPGFFPKILSVILIILSLILIYTSISKKQEEDVGLMKPENKKVYITMIIILIYLITLDMVGFLILTPILLFVLIRLYGMKGIIKNIIVSCIATGVIYGIFQLVLTVPLPSGILG